MPNHRTRFLLLPALSLLVALTACGPAEGDEPIEIEDTGTADVTMDVETGCGDARQMCGGECVDPESNIDHCGECGNTCPAGGFICSSGECQCIESEYTNCDGKCLNLQLDSQNCGACGNTCAPGERCEEGQCEPLTDIEEVVSETNRIRDMGYDCDTKGKYGPADPLEANTELHRAAQMHADNMADRRFFNHVDPKDGSDPFERMGRTDYQGQPGGENIARGQQTPTQVVQEWAESDGHCANMMNESFDEIGVGKAIASDGQPYWVQVFGRSQ